VKRFTVILFLLPAYSVPQTSGETNRPGQVSSGNCSPNIVNSGSGAISVQFTGSCNAVDPRLLMELTQNLQKFLAQFPKTIANLNELLDKKNVEIAAKAQEIETWTKKYSELSQRLEEQPVDDKLAKEAADALKQGNLSRAEALLKQLLSREEGQVDIAARSHFNLAEVYTLRFQPVLALPEYETAYHYRPNEFSYALDYATFLTMQNRFTEAQPVYLAALRNARDLAKDNNNHLKDVAAVLSNLGTVYSAMQRQKEAEDAFTECLATWRQLAEGNAAVYLPDVATTLNNLGGLYFLTRRLKEAEDAYNECLSTYREPGKGEPGCLPS
jgi:tetratricopeptide (TPR) repeat protein